MARKNVNLTFDKLLVPWKVYLNDEEDLSLVTKVYRFA